MATKEHSTSKRKVTIRPVFTHVQPTSRFGILFCSLLVTFILCGSLGKGRWEALLILSVESLTLIIALYATGARRILFIWIGIVITLGLFAGVLNLSEQSQQLDKAVSTISLLLVIVAPIELLRAVVKRRIIDFQTVMAALCFYLMIGLFFAFLFGEIQNMSNQHFFQQVGRGSASDLLYYSFVTMTTVGYGDLTAAHQVGRTISVGEAVLGQLYLVTVVALLVSNLGPMFKNHRSIEQDVKEGVTERPGEKDL